MLTLLLVVALSACVNDLSSEDVEAKKSDNLEDQLEVEERNRPWIVKHTGTNCSPCGSWGWGMFSELSDRFGEDAVYLAAYAYPEDYVTDLAKELSNYNDVQAFPTFSVNNRNILSEARSTGQVNVREERDLAIMRAEGFINDSVIINSAVQGVIQDGKMRIRYKTKAFLEVTITPVYVAVYVLENSITGHQLGHPTPDKAVHKHVFRAAMDGQLWGRNIGALREGDEIGGEAIIPIEEDWNLDNLELIVVTYQKHADTYYFANASKGQLINK